MSPSSVGALAAVAVSALAIAVISTRPILTSLYIHNRLARLNESKVGTSDRRGTDKTLRVPVGAMVIVLAGLAAVVALTVGVVPAAIVATVGFVSFKAVSIVARQRADQRYEKDLPLALDAMARGLRSGAGTLDAVREASTVVRGPLAADLRHIARDVDLGRGITDAFEAWSVRRPAESVCMFAGGISLALETGGAQAHVIDSVGEALRQTLSASAAANAAATESKASASALTVMPLLVSVPVLVTSESARAFMFHSTLGTLILFAGLGLNALGAFLMMHLIRRATA